MIFFYLLVSVMPLVRHPLWSDFIGDLTIIKYLGLICLFYALVHLPARSTPLRLFAAPQTRWFVAAAILGMVSFLAYGQEVALELSPFMNYLSFIIFMFITLVVVDSPTALRWTMLTAAASMAYASAHTVREWQKSGMTAGYRPGWITGDPNYFSVSAVLLLPIIFYMMRPGQPRWERWFCGGSLALTLFAVTLAASRGALLAVIGSLLLLIARSARPVRMFVLGSIILLPLLVIAPSTPLHRVFAPTYSDHESTENRTRVWDAGLIMIRHHLITGIGAGNFKPVLSRFANIDEPTIAHNTYIGIAAELGLPGLLLYSGMFFATFRSLARTRKRVPEPHDLIHRTALGIEAGLVAYLIAVFFISAEYQKFFWLLIFLSAALESLAITHASEAASRETGRRMGHQRQIVARS
jgi:putative inorganic carbon (hco3(-)) transporter